MATESPKPRRRKLALKAWLTEILEDLPPGYEINKITVREIEITLVSNKSGVRGMRVRRLTQDTEARRKK